MTPDSTTPSARTEQGVDLDDSRMRAADEKINALEDDVIQAQVAARFPNGEDGNLRMAFALGASWASLRSRLSPGSEATDDEMTEIVKRWATDHGFVTDASEHVYEDGETEPEIIADLVKRIAARRSVSATPDTPSIPPEIIQAWEAVFSAAVCEWHNRGEEPTIAAQIATLVRFFNDAQISQATAPAPGGGVPADVERLRECWGTVRDTLTSCTEYAEWRANNGGGDSHEIVTLDNHFRALPVPMLVTEAMLTAAIGAQVPLGSAPDPCTYADVEYRKKHGPFSATCYLDAIQMRAVLEAALRASVPPHTEEKT